MNSQSVQRQFYEYFTQLSCLFLLTFVSIGAWADEYDQTDRYQLLEDRNFIQRRITNATSLDGMYLNLSSHISGLGFALDLSSSADSVSAYENSFTEVKNKELATFVNFELIIPFRKIYLEEFELTPKFYLRADVGSLSYGQSRLFSEEEFDAWLLNFYSDDDERETIREILNFVSTLPTGGENVFQHLIDEGGCNTASLLTFCQTKRDAANAPIMPNDSDDKIFLYTKSQYKIGMLWDFQIVDDWTGYINIYGMQRGDYLLALDQVSAANSPNKPLGQMFLPDNYQQFVMVDAKFQLNMRPFKFHFLLEELRLTRWKDNIDEFGDLYFRNTSLYQFYASYNYLIEYMVLRPFAGFHKRRGYDLIDGVYVGADIFNSKSGSRLRLMLDRNNFSLMPSVRFSNSELIYQLHLPYSGTVEETITTEILHSLKLTVEI